jgi:hypothetical protein
MCMYVRTHDAKCGTHRQITAQCLVASGDGDGPGVRGVELQIDQHRERQRERRQQHERADANELADVDLDALTAQQIHP